MVKYSNLKYFVKKYYLEKDDYEIITTLEKCNLGKFIQERQKGQPPGHTVLDIQISEGGGNLSVGEKQLLCIARALLKVKQLFKNSF